MAFIGSLITTVKANTNPLKKNLKSARKTISKFSESFKKAAVRAAKLGAALGTAVVAGATAASIAILKLASDFEEANNKFAVVFGNVRTQSNAARAELIKDFGLSKTAATSLLSSTGDLLTGFGMTDQAALKMAAEVQKLSVDLASFNNTQGGAARVSRILTKALLGQRDGLTELGIGIQDADVKLRLAEKGQLKLQGTAKRVAIAYATMELALEQTTKAQGDFARSSGSLENLMKTIKARAEDLGLELGNKLLPAATLLAQKFLALSESTLKWADSNKDVVDSKIVETIEDLAEALKNLNIAIKAGSTAWNGFAGSFRKGLGSMTTAVDSMARKHLESVGPEETWLTHFSDSLFELGQENLDKVSKNIEDLKKAVNDRTGENFVSAVARSMKQARLDSQMKKISSSIDSAFGVGKEKVLGFTKALSSSFDKMVGISNISNKIKNNLEQQKEAAKLASVIFEETRTPLEKIESEIKSIMEVVNKGGFKGFEDALYRKVSELQKIKQELLLGDKIGQAKSDKATVAELSKSLMSPMQKLMEREQELRDMKARGGFGDREDIFIAAIRDIGLKAEAIAAEDEKKRRKQKEDEVGSFKELDLKNVDVAGLTGKENVEKKQLTEAEKTNKLLKQMVDKDDQKVPVAV